MELSCCHVTGFIRSFGVLEDIILLMRLLLALSAILLPYVIKILSCAHVLQLSRLSLKSCCLEGASLLLCILLWHVLSSWRIDFDISKHFNQQ